MVITRISLVQHLIASIALITLLVGLPALAAAPSSPAPGQPTDEDLHSPRWWLQQALSQAPGIKEPLEQANGLLYVGHRFDDRGELDDAGIAARQIDALLRANPRVSLPSEPQWMLLNAKVQHLGAQGKFEEGLAATEEIPDAGRRQSLCITLVAALSQHHQADGLRAAAASPALGSANLTAACVSGLVNNARLRRDRAAAQTALALLPKPDQAQNILANCLLACTGFETPFDAQGARMLVELMPDSPSRGDHAYQTACTLARKAFVRDALAVALLIPVTGNRAQAIRQVTQALVLANDAATAHQVINAERDPGCIAAGHFGLAVGLALRGEVDASRAQLLNLPKGQKGGDAAELEFAAVQGAMLHGDFQAGLAQLRVAKSTDLRGRTIADTVAALVQGGRLSEAEQVAALYAEEPYYALVEKGRLYWLIGQAHRAAKNAPAVQTTLKALDALVAKAPEKNEKETTFRLGWAHASLGDTEGGLALIAAMDTPEDRATGRGSVANGCAERGDFQGVDRALAAAEAGQKSRGKDTYMQPASIAAGNGQLRDLPAWIASWPDADARLHGYAVVATAVARLQR